LRERRFDFCGPALELDQLIENRVTGCGKFHAGGVLSRIEAGRTALGAKHQGLVWQV